MSKNKVYILAALSLTILMFGCGSSTEGDSNSSSPFSTVSSADITDATQLFIGTPSVSSKAMGSYGPNMSVGTKGLYKFTADGVILEVTFEDEAGNAVTTTNLPTDVMETGGDYVAICFTSSGATSFTRELACRKDNITGGVLLTRKSDGGAFALVDDKDTGFYVEDTNSIKNDSFFLSDNSGNIYYKDNAIYKIDTSNPASLTEQRKTQAEEDISSFIVDGSGNILYKASVNSQTVYRVLTASGTISPLPSTVSCFWLGADGKMYYNDGSTENPNNRVDVTDSTVDIVNLVSDSPGGPCSAGSLKYKLGTNTVFISGGFGGTITKMDATTNILPVTMSLPISSITLATASDDYFYVYGEDNSNNSTILKVNPLDDSYTTIDPSGYYFYTMNADANNEILFSALRYADAKKVMGKIDVTGAISIVDESNGFDVTVLERIR